jgi:hypothetical protein
VERTTIAGETEVLGENLPQCHFVPPQIPHDYVRFRTPDRSVGKPATNRLSYGAAKMKFTLGYGVMYFIFICFEKTRVSVGFISKIQQEQHKQTRCSGKNKLPTFLLYDMESIEKHASNNSSLPQERLYRIVT